MTEIYEFDFSYFLSTIFSNTKSYSQLFKYEDKKYISDTITHNMFLDLFNDYNTKSYFAKSLSIDNIMLKNKLLFIIENKNTNAKIRRRVYVCFFNKSCNIEFSKFKFNYLRGPYHLYEIKLESNNVIFLD